MNDGPVSGVAEPARPGSRPVSGEVAAAPSGVAPRRFLGRTLSMARWGAIPSAFGRVHPRFLTPSFSTLLMGGLSILWTIALLAFNPDQNVLGDTISALGFAVCFYYGFTGLACAFYYRRDLLRSVRNFVFNKWTS